MPIPLVAGGAVPSAVASAIMRYIAKSAYEYYLSKGTPSDIRTMLRDYPGQSMLWYHNRTVDLNRFPWLELRSLRDSAYMKFFTTPYGKPSIAEIFVSAKIASSYMEAFRYPYSNLEKFMRQKTDSKTDKLDAKASKSATFNGIEPKSMPEDKEPKSPGFKKSRFNRPRKDDKPENNVKGVFGNRSQKTNKIATSLGSCLSEIAFYPVKSFDENPDSWKYHYLTQVTNIAPMGFAAVPNEITKYVDGRWYNMIENLYARSRVSVSKPSAADIRKHFNAVFSLMRVITWMRGLLYLREVHQWTDRCSKDDCSRIVPDSVVDLTKYLHLTSARWPILYEPIQFTLEKCVLPPFWQFMAQFSVQPFTFGRIDDIIMQFRPAGLDAIITETALVAYLNGFVTDIKDTMNVSDTLASVLPWRVCLNAPMVLDESEFHMNIWMNNAIDNNPTLASKETIGYVSSVDCGYPALTSVFTPFYITALTTWINFARGREGDHQLIEFWNSTTHSWNGMPLYNEYGLKVCHPDATDANNVGRFIDTVRIPVTGERIEEYLIKFLPIMFGEEVIMAVLRGSDGSAIRATYLDIEKTRTICS